MEFQLSKMMHKVLSGCLMFIIVMLAFKENENILSKSTMFWDITDRNVVYFFWFISFVIVLVSWLYNHNVFLLMIYNMIWPVTLFYYGKVYITKMLIISASLSLIPIHIAIACKYKSDGFISLFITTLLLNIFHILILVRNEDNIYDSKINC